LATNFYLFIYFYFYLFNLKQKRADGFTRLPFCFMLD